MAEIAPGGGSGTGGFIGQGICVPSPSDLAGAIDNLLNRIKTLEDQMANVLGANLHADQLSDIAAQVGWVYGLTYAGVGGWIQTEAGSLIPPAGMSLSSLGFTMSDGNTYPMVVMDENGVLQFGFTNDGQVGGEQGALLGAVKADFYNGTASINYTDNSVQVFTGYNTQQSSGLVSIGGGGAITPALNGLYLLGLQVTVQFPLAAGADKKFLFGFGDGAGGWYNPIFNEVEITGQAGLHAFSGAFIFRYTGAPASIYCQCADTGVVGGTRTVDLNSMWIIRLRGLV